MGLFLNHNLRGYPILARGSLRIAMSILPPCPLPLILLFILASNHVSFAYAGAFKLELNLLTLGFETALNRANQQNKDCNLSFILIVTVVMFFIFHTPRIIISIYEAVTIQNLVRCTEKQKGYFLIWYLYVQAALQLLQV